MRKPVKPGLVVISDTLIETNLIVCLGMLREACSPYVPSSGRDNEWLRRRDRVVTNADNALSLKAAQGEKDGSSSRS